MIYAIRRGIYGEKTLLEFKSIKEMKDIDLNDPINTYNKCSNIVAHKWVREGHPHETGLWLDGTKIRYARPQS